MSETSEAIEAGLDRMQRFCTYLESEIKRAKAMREFADDPTKVNRAIDSMTTKLAEGDREIARRTHALKQLQGNTNATTERRIG